MDRRVVALVIAVFIDRAAIAIAAGVGGDDRQPLAIRTPGEAVGIREFLREEWRLLRRADVEQLSGAGRAVRHHRQEVFIVHLDIGDEGMVVHFSRRRLAR